MKKIEFKKKSVNKVNKRVIFYWANHYNFFVIFLLLLVSMFGIYLIYEKVYSSGWDDAEKQNYLNSKKNEIQFKESNFDQLLGEIESRRRKFDSNFGNSRDIFK